MTLATDPLARAAAPGWRTRTAAMPRLRALCGSATSTGRPCHRTARHPGGCLPPPARIRRPHEWPRR